MSINFGNNYSNIPYIVEGEIIGIHSYPKDTSKTIKPPRYICRVVLPNGSNIVINNVITSSMFGGVADYLQIRHRTSLDASKKTSGGAIGALTSVASSLLGGGGYEFVFNDEKMNAKVGDRVYICFINGFITRPVIIGYAQHPNQVDEFEGKDAADVNPKLIFQYNGIRVTVDEEGQLTVIHKGAPEISEKEGAGAKTYGKNLLGGAISALGLGPLEPENEAVKFPDQSKKRTLFEFLKDGTFRIRDSEGQIIEINKEDKEITLANKSLKSTEKPNDPKVLAKKALAKSSPIPLSESIKIKDKEIDIFAQKAVTIKSGIGTIKSENGKFAIGTQAAELIDIIDKILEQQDKILTAIQALTVPTSVGPSGPPVNTPDFASSQLELKVLKQLLGTIKGSV